MIFYQIDRSFGAFTPGLYMSTKAWTNPISHATKAWHFINGEMIVIKDRYGDTGMVDPDISSEHVTIMFLRAKPLPSRF